jgi:drug/metabolite transporter (DMT)-like permease
MPQLVSVVALSFTPVILAVAGRLAIPIGVSGFAGVLFLVSNSLGFSVTQLPWLVLPASAAVVLAWSLDSAEKRLPQMSVAENVFWSTATAAILLLVCSVLLEPEPVVWSATSVVGFIVCGAIATCCSYLIFYWLLGKLGAARVSMLQWTQPLIASAEGALLMRITPPLVAIAGAILIIFTVAYAFSNRGEFKGVMTEITQR